MHNNLTNSVLWEPVKIGTMEVRNRFVVPPIVTNFCVGDGTPSDKIIRYYEERAKGGWGLIFTEATFVHQGGISFQTMGLYNDDQIAAHEKLVTAVHKYGAKVIPQLIHSGRQTIGLATGGLTPVAPSPIPCPLMDEMPHELTVEEIKAIVGYHGDAALRAKKAGYDGVEIYSAHGYLIAQFLSLYSNKRIDEYGGCIENRLRFLMEIIADVKEKCGAYFPITVRVSGNELMPGGRGIEETKAMVIALERAGIDAIGVSSGLYGGSRTDVCAPLNAAPGILVDLAAEIKKVVNIPVIAVNRLNEPRIAESVILSGKADLIAIGRGSLADPSLPNKVKAGKLEDIRLCVACNQGCLDRLFKRQELQCMVNPTLGAEDLNDVKKTEMPKKVMVVGGGPAGLAAAIGAAAVGHEVTLYESRARLGGQFALAAIPPEGGLMACMLSWQTREAKKLGVKIMLNTKVSKEMIEELKPETVILATGCDPFVPPLPGIQRDNVYLAEDVLSGKRRVGNNVVVAGGHLIGAATATHIAMQRGRKVTIVGTSEIAPELEESRKEFLMDFIAKKDIKVMTGTKVLEIKEGCILLENAEGVAAYPCDSVVIALGVRVNKTLYEEIKDIPNLSVVRVLAGWALDANRKGYAAGLDA